MFEDFLNGAVKALLFSEVDEEGVPLEANYTIDDLDRPDLARFGAACAEFYLINQELFTNNHERMGVCFYFSWAGHGSGFFDEDTITNDDDRQDLQSEAEYILGRYGGPYVWVVDKVKIQLI